MKEIPVETEISIKNPISNAIESDDDMTVDEEVSVTLYL